MSRWAKMDANLDGNPKIRGAGRNGREVFLFILRLNAKLELAGHIPATYIQPWYLADQLQMSEADAEDGVSGCVRTCLVAVTDAAVSIIGWDDEWGRGSMSEAERKKKQRAARASCPVIDLPCVTYAIEALGTGRVKVGRTRDLASRLAKLQTGHHVELEVIGFVAGDVESAVHEELDDLGKRVRGEWFELDQETVDALGRYGIKVSP